MPDDPTTTVVTFTATASAEVIKAADITTTEE